MSSRTLSWLALALGLVLACAGVGAAMATPARSLPTTVVAPAPPPESAPSPVATALAGPPVRLRVPVIGVDAAVVPVVLDGAEVFAPGLPRVVLISCGGTFDRRLRHYADNVVVVAVPEPSRA